MRYECFDGYEMIPAESLGHFNCVGGRWIPSITALQCLPLLDYVTFGKKKKKKKYFFEQNIKFYIADQEPWKIWLIGLFLALVVGYVLGILSLAIFILFVKNKRKNK